MAFFVMPYRVLFHDTMAYGSHHFLTNFKFQCTAREHLFFEHVVEASAAGRVDHDNLVLLTQQAYARNLAPVEVGEKVAILVSTEEPTVSSVRFCFRVVRQDGAPTSCGFQTLVCTSKETQRLVPAPESISSLDGRMTERLVEPSFAERVLQGRLKAIFDEEVIALAKAVAALAPEESFPRFVDLEGATLPPHGNEPLPQIGNGVVFTFPGQSSYDPALLRHFYRQARTRGGGPAGSRRDLFEAADEVCNRLLGAPLSPLLQAPDTDRHDTLLAHCPALAQVGIYLGAVLAAHELMDRGLVPDLLVGHSAGELAALAVAGVYRPEAGIEIVCHRARALSQVGEGGGMWAVFGGLERVEALLAALGSSSLEVAVINHGEQVVVAGTHDDLGRLENAAAAVGLGGKRIPSPYPFHSRLLDPAVEPFARTLSGVDFKPPRIPVYSPMERQLYSPVEDLATVLASHFVRRFSFADAVRRLEKAGGRLFVECGGGKALSQFVRRVLVPMPGRDARIEVHSPFSQPDDDGEAGLHRLVAAWDELGFPRQSRKAPPSRPVAVAPRSGDSPVAVVAMGCLLPGAASPEMYWKNILEGRDAISDAARRAPDLAVDFCAPTGEVVADKTYTLLGGFIDEVAPDFRRLSDPRQDFTGLSRAQKFLAHALGQCLEPLEGQGIPGTETSVFLGATADGVTEYDEDLLRRSLAELAAHLEVDEEELAALRQALAAALGAPRGASRLSPYTDYLAVVQKLLGEDARLLTVDAACASSLYSVVLGMDALRSGACDLALAGGVFAPGPANSCLFSQFRGLSATGSRPFDTSADGVVFGEGAAMVALKRLPDALACGDRIHAVLLEAGLSSDGKSPSVAVPRRDGQVLALERAYRRADVDPATVGYIEAHATATPVGDAVEVSALSEVFRRRPPTSGPVALGSVKSLIGHTGWVAGAASILKMCYALESGTIPPQSNFQEPSPKLDLEGSPFVIPTVAQAWEPEGNARPRRGGVNGFGFGGSNAHLIMEAFDPRHHGEAPQADPLEIRPPAAHSAHQATTVVDRSQARIESRDDEPPTLAVVGVGALFPPQGRSPAPGPSADWGLVPDRAASALRFDRSVLTLPDEVRVLPDIADDMDPGQVLAVMAAVRALDGLGPAWREMRREIGVVLGLEGKSERGILANQRIYLDFLERRLAEVAADSALEPARYRQIVEALGAKIRRLRPSGPYTLPGLMPNVAAGRVANVLNLQGPNMVVSMGSRSLPEALGIAAGLLRRGQSRLVLAGAMASYAGPEVRDPHDPKARPLAEGILLLALATPETARARGFSVAAEIGLDSDREASAELPSLVVGEAGGPDLSAAEGTLELVQALHQARDGATTRVRWPPAGKRGATLRVHGVAARAVRPSESRLGRGARGPETPIHTATPRLRPVAAPFPVVPGPVAGRVLVLTDGPSLPVTRGFPASEPTLLAGGSDGSHDHAAVRVVDLSSDGAVSQALAELDPQAFDAIVAVKDLSGEPGLESLAEAAERGGLLDLLFAVGRWAYPRLRQGDMGLAALLLAGVRDGRVHPASGLYAGFLKSLARELPAAVCKVLTTDTTDLGTARDQLWREWRQGPLPAPTEVVYEAGVRHEFRLETLPEMASGDEPWLDSESVVVASGGGRGVTAVLAEEMLSRFACTVVLLGRTDPEAAPAEVLAMDEKAFEEYEPEFYRRELEVRPQPVKVLKRRFEGLRSAREVEENLRRLRALPGRVEYRVADITDAEAVDEEMARIAESHSRLDLIVHGAGIQASKMLTKKPLEEFRRIVATKVGGLVHLHRAAGRHFGPSQPRFHLLTSAFSFFGNDGQPDYGAANEALNRVADRQAETDGNGHWTSLAWLGWSSLGMTRGSEYAALARARGLRAVTRQEGRSLFSALLSGRPQAPVNVLISQGEMAFYGVELDGGGPSGEPRERGRSADGDRIPGPSRETVATLVEWDLTLRDYPYLRDHRVRECPTLPGAVEAELAAQAAQALFPDHVVARLSNIELHRFVKLHRQEGLRLRARTRVMEDGEDGVRVRVRLLSDFVYRDGRVLQKDLVHFTCEVRLRACHEELTPCTRRRDTRPGVTVRDPYLSHQAPVRLGGIFRCLHRIELGEGLQRATFRIEDPADLGAMSKFLLPAVLLDGLFRFAMIHRSPGGGLPVYVPLHCGRALLSGRNDAQLHATGEELHLLAPRPRVDGETIHNDWAQVTDARGAVLLSVHELIARRAGEVLSPANRTHPAVLPAGEASVPSTYAVKPRAV